MNFELTAKVKQVLPVVTGSGASGNWGRCSVVTEYQDGSYPKMLVFENKNKYEEFAKLKVGQTVKFKFDIVSREWQGKYFTSAVCFAWQVLEDNLSPQQTESAQTDHMPF